MKTIYQLQNSGGELTQWPSLPLAAAYASTWEKLLPGRTHTVRRIHESRRIINDASGRWTRVWSNGKKSGWHKIGGKK